jgi:hypothetical protein
MKSRMLRRVPQPPINPALRSPERHDFWTGIILAVIALAILVSGARHLTKVDTTNENAASETDLMRAFATSGIKYASQMNTAPPPPPVDADPAKAAEALERWAKTHAKDTEPTWKIRVDTEAKTPCPT